MRVLDNDYKLQQNIKIAMLYLEDDDAIQAEVFIKKAATLIASCKVPNCNTAGGCKCVQGCDCLCSKLVLRGSPPRKAYY